MRPFLFALTLVAVGCVTPGETPPGAAQAPATRRARAGQGTPEEMPPRTSDAGSVTERFLARGGPSPDQAWGGLEYLKASVFLLQSIDGYAQLPRHTGAVDAALFARFVSEENLVVARDERLPRQARSKELIHILDGAKTLFLLYGAAQKQDPGFVAEGARLQTFRLAAAALWLDIVEAELASRTQAAEAQRSRAVRASSGGAFSGTVNETLPLLAGDAGATADDRLLLARALEQHLPRHQRALPDEARSALQSRLQTLGAQEPHPEVRAVLERLARGLSGEPLTRR
jgi:hypothetical protein